jgi:hypothetical protein
MKLEHEEFKIIKTLFHLRSPHTEVSSIPGSIILETRGDIVTTSFVFV